MAGHIDRFANLPDCLLFMIVSYLPFKESARTSILSRRWRNIWRGTSDIQLAEGFFVDFSEPKEAREVRRQAFVGFMCRWIEKYIGFGPEKFFLSLSSPLEFQEQIDSLIEFAVSRKVKSLHLDFSEHFREPRTELETRDGLYKLPSLVYQNGAIESLKVLSCKLDLSQFKNFRALNELSLGWIHLTQDSIISILVYCPLLESLSLSHCRGIESLEIAGPNLHLRKLVIEDCEFINNWFHFDTPNLAVFKYFGEVGDFKFERIGKMQDVELDFRCEDHFDEFGDLLSFLLHDFTSAQILSVCSYLLQDYSPPFAFRARDFWVKHVTVCQCAIRTLKVVEVQGFKGTWNEMAVLQYLLHVGRVMERLDLYISKDLGTEARNMTLQRTEKVRQFRKESNVVLITVHD